MIPMGHREPLTIMTLERPVSITLNFPIVYTQDGLSEPGSSFKEIFLVAPFEKSPKLMIFLCILHSEFTQLIENIFRQQICILDKISFHLIGRTVYFKKEKNCQFFYYRCKTKLLITVARRHHFMKTFCVTF